MIELNENGFIVNGAIIIFPVSAEKDHVSDYF
jgi:hypothetical protein